MAGPNDGLMAPPTAVAMGEDSSGGGAEEQAPAPEAAAEGSASGEAPAFDDWFNAGVANVAGELDQTYNQVAQEQQKGLSTYGKLENASQAGLVGVAKAGFELYDLIAGEPEEKDKTDFRKTMEMGSNYYSRLSAVNSMTEGTTQFVTGMIGLNKFLAPLKGLKAAAPLVKAASGSKLAKFATLEAKGAAVSAGVFDPHQSRLANFLGEYPIFQGSVTDYLSAKPEDTAAEGRFKNALESLGMGVGLGAAFAGVVKGVRYLRNGNPEAAARIFKKAAQDMPAEIPQSSLARPEAGAAPPFGKAGGAPFSPSDEVLSKAQKFQGPGEALIPDVEAPGKMTGGTGETSPITGVLPDAPPDLLQQKMAATAGKTSNIKDAPKVKAEPQQPLPRDLKARGKEAGASKVPGDPALPPTPAGKPQSVGGAANPDPTFDKATGKLVSSVKQGLDPDGPPTGLPQVSYSEEDVARIMKSADEDVVAIEKAGSRQAAEEGGHVFAKPFFEFEKIGGSAEMQALVSRVSEAKAETYNIMRGGQVLTDRRVNAQVQQMHDIFGVDPGEALGIIRRAGKDAPRMAATITSGFEIGSQALARAMSLHAQIKNGILPATDIGKIRKIIMVGSDAIASAKAMLTNSARSTRRGHQGLGKVDYEAMKNMDDDALMALFDAVDGDITKLAQSTNPGWWKKSVDLFNHLMVNGPLWLYPSHVRSALSGAIMLAHRPMTKMVGAGIMKLGQTAGVDKLPKMGFLSTDQSGVLRAARKEHYYTVTAIQDAYENAKWAWRHNDSKLIPHSNIMTEASGSAGAGHLDLSNAPKMEDAASVAWWAKFATGIPTRALGVVDEGTKTMRARGVAMAQAAVEAEDMGLSGKAFEDHLKLRMSQAFDERGALVDPGLINEARQVVFQNPMFSKLGKNVEAFVNNVPFMRAVVTYVRTPWQATSYGARLTPGLNVLHGKWRADFLGKNGAEAQAHAVGELALGAVYTSALYQVAQSGILTGGGPNDPKIRADLMRTGWKPYSVHIPGTNVYINYGNLDPVGMLAGIVADHHELYGGGRGPEYEEQAEGVWPLMMAVVNNVKNRSFLAAVDRFLDGATNPGSLGARTAGGIAEAVLPFSSLIRGLNPDPYMHEARTVYDEARKRMPGNGSLPITRDLWGDPVEASINSLWSNKPADAVDLEMQRLYIQTGRGPSKMVYGHGGVDLRDMTTDDGKTNAYDRIQVIARKPSDSSPTLKEKALRLMQSKGYQAAPDGYREIRGTRLFMLDQLLQAHREAAYKILLKQNPKLAAATQQRVLKTRAAGQLKRFMDQEAADKQPGSPKQIRSQLEQLGVQLPNSNQGNQ